MVEASSVEGTVEVKGEVKGKGGNFVCPRCGGLGYLDRRVRGEHVYFYCMHIERVGNRRRVHRCYLGAESYDYVERFQEMSLSGLMDKERFARYLDVLIPRLERKELLMLVRKAKERLKVLKD
jgi:hypothetical protein